MAPMTRCLTRPEWELERAKLNKPALSVAQHAEHVKSVWCEWQRDYPGMNTSNGRYVAHLEDTLKRGLKVPDDCLDDVNYDELKYDGYAFPLLSARLANRHTTR